MNEKVATARPLHPIRVHWRKIAAQVLADAQSAVQSRGDGSVTDRKLAKRWSISHAAIQNFFKPSSGYAMALGDVLALPVDLAREALVRAFGELEDGGGASIRDTLDAIVIEMGVALDDWRRDLTDGREDQHELHVRHLTKIATITMRGLARAKRDSR